MPGWFKDAVLLVQILLNFAAVGAGAAVWKLYIANLRAAVTSKDATIETVEKSRDFWKEKAEELEKRSPEVVEVVLAERIQIRDGEIARLKADKEFDKDALRSLEINKSALEQDLFRTQGFRSMLAMEGEEYSGAGETPTVALHDAIDLAEQVSTIEVELIGEVAVDSGQLMVTDPSYVDAEWRREPFSTTRNLKRAEDNVFHYSYDGACRATLSGGGHGELAFKLGHAGAGVAFATAWGDGMYPVYAEKHDGRIVRVYVNVA